jgi:hypothetical protein
VAGYHELAMNVYAFLKPFLLPTFQPSSAGPGPLSNDTGPCVIVRDIQRLCCRYCLFRSTLIVRL